MVSDRHRMTTAFATLLSALAFYASTGLGEFWPLAWVAPAPVLWLACRRSPRHAIAPAAVAWFLGSLNLFEYLSRVMPAPIVLALLMGPGIVFGLVVAFTGAATRRLGPVAGALAFPAAWTSYEFLLSLVSPHGTALSLGYSQIQWLTLMQIVSVTGLWGVVFLVTSVPSSIAAALSYRSPRALAPPAVLLLAAVSFGAYRLQHAAASHPIRVGLAVTDTDIGRAFETTDAATMLAVVRGYGDRIDRLARDGAILIVLPEKMTGVTPTSAPEAAGMFADAARRNHVTVVAGINRVAIDPLRNVAWVFGPDGRQLVEYDKHHMLPGPETGYLVGAQPALFSASNAQAGVAICKDMDFQGWSREYGRRDVRLLAVPAWDFVVDGRLHFRMALARGIENGFAMVRAAEEGLLTVTDGYGRMIAWKTSGSEALLVADVEPGPGATFYTRTGDWCGWLAVGLTAGLALFSTSKVGRRATARPAGGP
jgi:apolipoprotein N-acyltransferase